MEFYWILVAFIAGAIAQLIRIPTLVGYIGAGIVLAMAGVSSGAFIDQTADFGITMLLFTVGLHIRLKNVFQKEVFGTGMLHLLFSMVLFTAVTGALGLSLNVAVLVATSLGFSSTVLTAKALEARNELDAYHGRVAMGILILQDIVAIILLALTGTETPEPWIVGLLFIPLLRPIMYRLLDAFGYGEMILLFGLVMAVGMGEIFSFTGISGKLGALAAGILLADHPRAEQLYDRLWGLKEVFLVSFFLQVGLAGAPDMESLLVMLLLLALLPLKGIMFFLLLTRFQLRARTAFVGAMTLTAYSEFALIVGAAAVDSGLMEDRWLTALALTIAVSYVLNALLGRYVNFLWKITEPTLSRAERNIEHPDQQPRRLGSTNYLVVGMGRVGTAAYDHLKAQGQRPLGLESDPERIEQHLEMGRRVVFAESQDPELWENLEMGKVKGILFAIPNAQQKVYATQMIREAGYDGSIVAIIRDGEQELDALKDLNVSSLMVPFEQLGQDLAKSILEQHNITTTATP